MDFQYDVAVIGAGPVGSTIAYYLSKSNLNVALIEKKKEVGYPLQCAGILSTHIRHLNELPDNLILNEIKGAYLHSKNQVLKVDKDESVAYVIDRVAYDQFLLKRAIDEGAELIFQKATDFDIEKGITYLQNSEKITSKIIVGCDGYESLLSRKLSNDLKYFNASQMLVEIRDDLSDDYVDTVLIDKILPGFLWVIPTEDNLYRVGLFSNLAHKNQDEIIKNYLSDFDYEIKEKYKGFIPVFNKNNVLVKSRALLIGDAASQIKPTSGGGLSVAFDACKMALKYISESINKNNLEILEGYQKEFNDKYLKEFSWQFKVQKTLNLFSDDDFDYFFEKLKKNDGERIISEYGDMDYQSDLVKEFIKRGLLFKIIPTFFIKKVSKIFLLR